MNKTGIRISNNIGTVMNEYPSEGLQITIIKDGQETIAYVDGQLDAPGNAPAAGSSASGNGKPVIPQGASELGQLYAIWNGTVDSAGRLLGKQGQVLTEPENTDPLPTKFSGVEALLQWQIDHPYYKNPLLVDGTPVGQPGFGAPSGFGSQADGSLIALQANPQPVPVAVLPEIPDGDVSDQFYFIEHPPSGQRLTRTNGLTTGYAVFDFVVPKPYQYPTAGRLGSMRVTERPGSDVLPRAMTVYVNGAVAHSNYDDGDTSPGVDFSINGKHSNAHIGLEPGDSVRVTVRTIGYRPGHPADILFDLMFPGRNR